MVMTFDSSRRPCDSEALATSSYGMNLAQPLSGQGGLAMVDVTDGADVHVRFTAIEFFFGHVRDPRAACDGADVQDRTGDLVLTKDALCQLSYIGKSRSLVLRVS
jgi:hypothetical protein